MSAEAGKGLGGVSDKDLEVLLGIHCGLSPENLSGDGELSRNESRKRMRKLLQELEAVRVRLGLEQSDVEETAVLMEDSKRRRERTPSVGRSDRWGRTG